MKHSIKMTNQLTKILEIYAEYRIHRFNSNTNLLHIRLVPLNISDKYTASEILSGTSLICKRCSTQYFWQVYSLRLHKNTLNHTKDQIACFSWVFKKIQSEWDEGKRIAQLFLYWFTQSQSYIQFTRTWAWFPLYSKFLQITHQDYTFEQQNSQDFWLTQNLHTHPTRITLTNLKSHQANQPEAQEHPNLMVVVPSQPYMCSSTYSQAKMPPRSTKIFKTRVVVVYCRERAF